MRKSIILVFVLAPLSFSILSTSFDTPNSDCKNVKTGTFYVNKENGKFHSRIIRKDSIQTEINLVSKDTTYWRLSWHSDCEFSCSYISGSNKKTDQELDFYKKSTLRFKIREVTSAFYTYTAELTYNKQVRSFTDTLWTNPR